MRTKTRKQREIQEREQSILQISRTILVHEGYASLTMDRLAAEMEYAKGTLYNHFPNKEEIVVALAIESMELRRSLFEKASVSRRLTRERMAAIGCACDFYATRYVEHAAVEEMMRHGVVFEKSSEIRKSLVKQCELGIMSIVSGIVRDAVAVGDLVLPELLKPEEFVFGFWSLMFGSQLIMATSPTLSEVGVIEPTRSIRFHAWTLMNGYNWQPLVTFQEMQEMMDSLTDKWSRDVHR